MQDETKGGNMTRRFAMTLTIGTVAAMVAVSGAVAQPRQDPTQLGEGSEPSPDVRHTEGKVVDAQPAPNMVAMIELDNGAHLAVPPESTGPGVEPQIGDRVVARYVENGAGKVATRLRVIERQTP